MNDYEVREALREEIRALKGKRGDVVSLVYTFGYRESLMESLLKEHMRLTKEIENKGSLLSRLNSTGEMEMTDAQLDAVEYGILYGIRRAKEDTPWLKDRLDSLQVVGILGLSGAKRVRGSS